MGGRRQVVREHQASREDPIAMRAGDPVTVGRRDTTWPEYAWCTGADEREGWVPEAFLEAAGNVRTPDGAKAASAVRTARRDNDARELVVAPGDVVLAREETCRRLVLVRGRGRASRLGAGRVLDGI
jgi:hypothetical protein